MSHTPSDDEGLREELKSKVMAVDLGGEFVNFELHRDIRKFNLSDEFIDDLVALISQKIIEARIDALDSLHHSIMRHELPLGQETDQAFNYARIHRWIDSNIATLTTKQDIKENL